MLWAQSLERYLIAKDCGLRLSLAGTVSTSVPVIRALRQGLLTGIPGEVPGIPACVINQALGVILNTCRKADIIIPVGTRVYWGEDGQIRPESDSSCKVTLDFASVRGNSACFHFVTGKKFGGTPAVRTAYALIAESIRNLYPGVEKVFVRELILAPIAVRSKPDLKFDVLAGPPYEICFTGSVKELMADIMKMPEDNRSDKRKCKVTSDPCPAQCICPILN